MADYEDCTLVPRPLGRGDDVGDIRLYADAVLRGVGQIQRGGGLLRALCGTYQDQTVLVVGHQPTLGRLAARLLAGDEADWTIKKGALWWFSKRAGDLILRAVVSPDLL